MSNTFELFISKMWEKETERKRDKKRKTEWQTEMIHKGTNNWTKREKKKWKKTHYYSIKHCRETQNQFGIEKTEKKERKRDRNTDRNTKDNHTNEQKENKVNKNKPMARSHGLVVKAEDSWSRDCGFESRCHILNGCKQCYSYYIINCTKKITKIKIAKWGTPNFFFIKKQQKQTFLFSKRASKVSKGFM